MGSLSMREGSCGDGNVLLIAEGLVDDNTVEQFECAIDAAIGRRNEPLIIDLSRCQLASAGLAALIRLQRSSERRPATTLLVASDVDLLWTLQVVGLTYWCEVFETLDAALESCSGASLSIAGVLFE